MSGKVDGQKEQHTWKTRHLAPVVLETRTTHGTLSAKSCTDKRWGGTACSRGAMSVLPALCWHTAVPSSHMPCQCVGLQAQHPVEEVVDSSLGSKVPLLVSLLHLGTPVLSPCGHVPFLLPFLYRLLPTPSHSCTITLASSNPRKLAIDLSCPKPLPHLFLHFQVTVPALKHSLPML